MATSIFLGKPPTYIQNWLNNKYYDYDKAVRFNLIDPLTRVNVSIPGEYDSRNYVFEDAHSMYSLLKSPTSPLVINNEVQYIITIEVGCNTYNFAGPNDHVNLDCSMMYSELPNLWHIKFNNNSDLNGDIDGSYMTDMFRNDDYLGLAFINEFYLPDHVSELANNTFNGCSKIKKLYCYGVTGFYDTSNSIRYVDGYEYPDKSVYAEVSKGLFAHCTLLKEIFLPKCHCKTVLDLAPNWFIPKSEDGVTVHCIDGDVIIAQATGGSSSSS